MSTTGAQSSAQSQTANRLNTQDLVAGDIIATRSDTTTSTVVRAATFGRVSATPSSKRAASWALSGRMATP
jgi:hypothetical protein